MRFEFATAHRVVFGPGSLAEAGSAARACGSRALLVTGRSTQRSAGLRQLLEAHGIATVPLTVTGEPTLQVVEAGTALARQAGCYLVIACGGGSVLDAGKAIAALLPNPGQLLDYLEVIGLARPLPQAPLPFIALPTTAGTGTEATRNAVLSSPEHRVKVSLRSPLMLPHLAIVDPELTLDLPRALTATTGLDALTQLIEPLVSCRANPMVDGLCREGITRAARSLRRACDHGPDLAAREDMCLASLFGGLALANAGLGAVHGFAAPLGGMFPAPHGAICAILLPEVMATNLQALRLRSPQAPALDRYTEIACSLTQTPDAAPETGVEWVRELVAALEIPRLRTYGVQPGDLPAIVAKASQASSMKGNPLPLTITELTGILEAAW
jgi:alcohol dehydrogenase class IV